MGYLGRRRRTGRVYAPSVETPVEVIRRTVSDPAPDLPGQSSQNWTYDYNQGYSLFCSGKWDVHERITTTLQPDGYPPGPPLQRLAATNSSRPSRRDMGHGDYGLPFTQTTVNRLRVVSRLGDPACAHSAARFDPTGGTKKNISPRASTG